MRLIMVALISIFFSGCLLLNTIGLNPGHIQGEEASSKILDAALLADIIQQNTVTSGFFNPMTSVVAEKIAYLDPDGYYKESDVDECISNIYLFGSFRGSILAVLAACDLHTDNPVYDP